jgi:hypothetical protein
MQKLNSLMPISKRLPPITICKHKSIQNNLKVSRKQHIQKMYSFNDLLDRAMSQAPFLVVFFCDILSRIRVLAHMACCPPWSIYSKLLRL